MSKLEKAISFCKNSSDYENFNKGLQIFNELITNSLLSVNIRIKALIGLYRIAPDEAIDKIVRFRDSLSFLEGEKLDQEIKMLSSLIEYPQINSHERLLCAVCLYNNDYIEICYDLFAHLANDISVLVDYRIEATRYLFYSEVSSFIKIAKRCISMIIDSLEYPSTYRYNVIAGFITTTGLSTMLNRERLNVEYNEKFVHQLQYKFFWNDKNGTRERILSGQHMLDMNEKIVSNDDKNNIIHELLTTANEAEGEDEEDTTNIRADAADVVMRLGNAEQKDKAKTVIRNLGFMIGGNGKRITSLSEKHRTVYSDKQNVHDSTINKSVNEFIEKLVNTDEKIDSYQNTHAEITDIIYSYDIKAKDRIKAFKALNRISIDTATFTELRVTSAEIFVHVWRLIKKHNEDINKVLKKRLIEELIDMADTCSSGHASRLINILSGYDVEIKISWEDQIHANMSARMQKKIHFIEDEELQEKVVMGMTEDAEDEDRDTFIKFVENNIDALRKELYKEFVTDGYIKEDEFNKHFESGTTNWL